MILDVSPHNRWEADCSISPKGRSVGAPLEIFYRFTAYSIYPIKLKFGRMILVVSPYNFLKPDFSTPSRGALWLLRWLQQGYSSQLADWKGRAHLATGAGPGQEFSAKFPSFCSERWPQRPFGSVFDVYHDIMHRWISCFRVLNINQDTIALSPIRRIYLSSSCILLLIQRAFATPSSPSSSHCRISFNLLNIAMCEPFELYKFVFMACSPDGDTDNEVFRSGPESPQLSSSDRESKQRRATVTGASPVLQRSSVSSDSYTSPESEKDREDEKRRTSKYFFKLSRR